IPNVSVAVHGEALASQERDQRLLDLWTMGFEQQDLDLHQPAARARLQDWNLCAFYVHLEEIDLLRSEVFEKSRNRRGRDLGALTGDAPPGLPPAEANPSLRIPKCSRQQGHPVAVLREILLSKLVTFRIRLEGDGPRLLEARKEVGRRVPH